MDPDCLPDALELCLEGDFDDQVEQLLQQIRLSRQQVEGLTPLFHDIEEMLQFMWPGCSVKPFGSIITGLGIISSDVDCYAQLPEGEIPSSRTVIQARNRLRQFPHIFTELFAITTAKVPVLKCYHIPTGYHCDINFTSLSGIYNSKLVAYLLHLDPRAVKLAVIIKYWSKIKKITGTNLMPNYGLTLLVIFYLQQICMLPSVKDLQSDVECLMTDYWNTNFNNNYLHRTTNNESLYKLLGGFFSYYGTFDFEENIICPYLGFPIRKKSFDLFLTKFSLYQHNVAAEVCKPLRLDTPLCIQDPFDHSRNCSVNIYPKLVTRIVDLFKSAAETFHKDKKPNFLREILQKNTENIYQEVKYKHRKTKFLHNKVQKVQFNVFRNNHYNRNRGRIAKRGKR